MEKAPETESGSSSSGRAKQPTAGTAGVGGQRPRATGAAGVPARGPRPAPAGSGESRIRPTPGSANASVARSAPAQAGSSGRQVRRTSGICREARRDHGAKTPRWQVALESPPVAHRTAGRESPDTRCAGPSAHQPAGNRGGSGRDPRNRVRGDRRPHRARSRLRHDGAGPVRGIDRSERIVGPVEQVDASVRWLRHPVA